MTTDTTATDQQNEQKPIVIKSWVSLTGSIRGAYGLGNPKWWFGPGKWLPDKYRIPRWLYRYTKRKFEEYLLHGYDSDDLSINSYDSSSSGSSDSSEKNGNNTEETVIVKPPAANGNNTEETGIVKPPAAKTFERVKDENGYTKWQAWLPENELFRPPTTENKQVEFRLRATVWAYGMFSFGRHSNPSHAPNAGLGAYNDRLGERQTPRNVPGSIVNDTTVGVDGRLTEQRLDRCLDHLPIVATQKKKCALHRWLGFRKEGKNLLYCRACNVTLCSVCYDDFHKVNDLTEIKCLKRKPNGSNAGLGAYTDGSGERQTTRNIPRSIANDTVVGSENGTLTKDLAEINDLLEQTCLGRKAHTPNAGDGAYTDRLGERQTARDVPGSIVNDTTVGVDGTLTERRLDTCLDHLPIEARQKKKCALHRWLGFRKEGKSLLYCRACNVTLCSVCYDDFHKVQDLTEIKYWLKQECLERQEKPTKGYWNEKENLEENWPREGVLLKRCLTSQEVIDHRMNNFK